MNGLKITTISAKILYDSSWIARVGDREEVNNPNKEDYKDEEYDSEGVERGTIDPNKLA